MTICAPTVAGARCSECPLAEVRQGPPVLAEHRPGATIIAVGQEPGRVEVKTERVLSGPSGMLFDRALELVGLRREVVSTTNVVACMPPGGDIGAFERKLPKDVLKPTEACSGRLALDLQGYSNVIPLGAKAAQAILGIRGGLERVRGRIFTREDGKRVVPTYNPAYLLREGVAFRPVFQLDLRKALRFFRGDVDWAEPEFFFRPSVQKVEELLKGAGFPFLSSRGMVWDVETNHAPAVKARLYCVGVGTPDWAVNIPLEGAGGERFYDSYEESEIYGLLRFWARRADLLKIGWNSGVFDRLVFENRVGVNPLPIVDGILLKKSASPSWPHDLGFSGSVYTSIHNWKGDFWGKKEPKEEERWDYNLKDVVVTGRVVQVLAEHVSERQQWGVVQVDHVSQDAGVQMHLLGMGVDQVERRRLAEVYFSRGSVDVWAKPLQRNGEPVQEPNGKPPLRITRKQGKVFHYLWLAKKLAAAENAGSLQDMPQTGNNREGDEEADGRSQEEVEEGWVLPYLHLEDSGFNPLSHVQLRWLLFDRWELAPPATLKPKEMLTTSGELSTSDAVLRALIISGRLKPWQRHLIDAVRMARRWAKLYGTYIHPLRLRVGEKVLDKGAICWEDGRIHSDWQVHTPITGRYSSRKPNAQNMPLIIKMLLVAAEGNVLVGGDEDQVEFRLAAARWGITPYLDAFKKKIDPYQMTMEIVFGRSVMMKFDGAPEVFGSKKFRKDSEFERMRKLAKQVQLASQYGASLQTVYRLVTSAEDKETGELLFANITLAEVSRMHERWHKGCPEYRRGWAADQALVRRQGYICEPIHGRRRDFQEPGLNLSEEVNFCIQSSAAALMNDCVRELVRELPFDIRRNVGLINQCHDSLTIEVPEKDGEYWSGRLTRIMNREYGCFPGMLFTSDVRVGYRLGET